MPIIRHSPEDFFVDEIPRFEPSGEGPYAWIKVEKRLENSEDVARVLAQALDLATDQVDFAGRKDRRAVTRQFFSLPWRPAERLLALDLPGAKVLSADRHSHRLGPGKLAGNRFVLVVREVDAAAAELASRRLVELKSVGMPNRFGKQRFGNDGQNSFRGREILLGRRQAGGRKLAWLMLSALQAEVFNRVLERRISELDRVWPGDVGFVHATGETIWLRGDPEEQRRADLFELSATGPIFGSKMKRPRGRGAELEATVLAELELPNVDHLDLPRGLRIYGDRRPLRVPISDLAWSFDDPATLRLEFILPPGAYATVLIEEIFPGGFVEGSEDRAGELAEAED